MPRLQTQLGAKGGHHASSSITQMQVSGCGGAGSFPLGTVLCCTDTDHGERWLVSVALFGVVVVVVVVFLPVCCGNQLRHSLTDVST